MTRQERVRRYIEILEKKGKSNNTVNWSILDNLSDEELFNDAKIAECLTIIDKHDMRVENNSNNYPENIMCIVRETFGIDRFDESMDAKINAMTPDEVFECVCNKTGLVNCAGIIKALVVSIYKVNLERG